MHISTYHAYCIRNVRMSEIKEFFNNLLVSYFSNTEVPDSLYIMILFDLCVPWLLTRSFSGCLDIRAIGGGEPSVSHVKEKVVPRVA